MRRSSEHVVAAEKLTMKHSGATGKSMQSEERIGGPPRGRVGWASAPRDAVSTSFATPSLRTV